MNTQSGDDRSQRGHGERGFTLIELIIATVVLMVGVISVMQLVPSSIKLNLQNRNDTSSAVVAQRMRDLMEQQAASDSFINDSTGVFPCTTLAANCSFGPLAGGASLGCPVNAAGLIDFNQNCPAGYSFLFPNPDDPAREQYEVRWHIFNVIGSLGGANVVLAKRVVVGVRRAADPSFSVSFVSLIAR